ncbi:MAG TPA: TonB-dependent receptor [Steroidobacteraceae bacterium]|jgi:outer membrane receptor protein involved in Fe transport
MASSWRRTIAYRATSSLILGSARLEGTLGELWGRDLKLRMGVDVREQQFNTHSTPVNPAPPVRADLRREVVGGFAQLSLPLPGKVVLNAALREDHYSDIGGATAPQLGLAWSPIQSITLRSTWTRAFRPPNLPDLSETGNQSGLVRLPDPSSPQGSTALVWTENNADLKPERANNWTLGAGFSPQSIPGLSLGVTYFDTLVRGRVEQTSLEATVLSDPTLAATVNRNPTDATRAAVCSRSSFRGTPQTCLTAPIGEIVDLRLRNAERVATRGVDVDTEYVTTTDFGKVKAGLLATYLFSFDRQDTAAGPDVGLLNTPHEPLNLRFRASLSWSLRQLSSSLFLNYSNHYRNTLSRPEQDVASWATVDLQIAVTTADEGPFRGVQIAFNAQNLFNRNPPFVNNPVGVGYDQENADLLGRPSVCSCASAGEGSYLLTV